MSQNFEQPQRMTKPFEDKPREIQCIFLSDKPILLSKQGRGGDDSQTATV